MTTTTNYSGYKSDGNPSSRVLKPPGGASSNIFGGPEPTPQQQVRQEQQKDAQRTQAGQQKPDTSGSAKQEYSRNKGRADSGEAPYALFTESGKPSVPTQFDKGNPGSQNDADFRCYSVTDYRNAIATNAAVRQRAHGQAVGSFNPITHEETGAAPYQEYSRGRPHPEQVSQAMRGTRGQSNYSRGQGQYNPITGEEYPDYGKQKPKEEGEEQETEDKKDQDKEDVKKETPAQRSQKPEESKPGQFQKVRQPPGGKSSGLW